MNNTMTVKGQTVVLAGKVRGYIYTTVLTNGSIYRRFVPKFNQPTLKEETTMRIDRPTGQSYLLPKREPAIKKVEPVIEIPSFMQDYSRKKREDREKKEKQEQRKKCFKTILNNLL